MLNHILNKGVIIDHVESFFVKRSGKSADLQRFSFRGQKDIFQIFHFFRPANEKRHKSAGFQDFSEFFFIHGQLLPPYSLCGSTLILGGIKKLQKAKI